MPFDAHLRLVEEDAAEMIAVGKDLGLVRQVRAAAVDQIDARQAVRFGDLLRAEMFLDRQRIVSAAFDRRVVADDHHLPARHAADAGDDARARHFAFVHVAGGELADLEERRARIEQPLDAIAWQQFAARRGGVRGCFSVPPFAASATSARSFSASARLCAARARNSSLSVTILLSIRGALMPCRRPLVEKPCRPPSRCCRRWQSSARKGPPDEARMNCLHLLASRSRSRALQHAAAAMTAQQQAAGHRGRHRPRAGWTSRSSPATTSSVTPTAPG